MQLLDEFIRERRQDIEHTNQSEQAGWIFNGKSPCSRWTEK